MGIITDSDEITHVINSPGTTVSTRVVAQSKGIILKAIDWLMLNTGRAIYHANDWIWQKLDALKNWTIEQLVYITEELKVWKYHFTNTISQWLDNPVAFWLTLAGIVVLACYLPQIISWMKGTKAWIAGIKIFDTLKKFTGTFLEKIGYIQALEVHKIFLLIDKDYQDFWRDIDEAFMSFAEQIEIGVGTINNLTYSVRQIYFSTYSIIGLDSDTIEMKFYDDATKFWSKAQKNIERYIRNPQVIFEDLMKELVYPILNEQSKLGSDRINHEIEQAKKVNETIENLDELRDGVNSLVSALPEEIQKSINKHVGGAIYLLNTTVDSVLLPFKEKSELVIDELETTIDEIKNAVASNALKRSKAVDGLLLSLFDGTLDIKEKRELLAALLGKIISPELKDQNNIDTLFIATNVADSIDENDKYNEENNTIQTTLFTLDFSKIVPSIDGWYVGEY